MGKYKIIKLTLCLVLFLVPMVLFTPQGVRADDAAAEKMVKTAQENAGKVGVGGYTGSVPNLVGRVIANVLGLMGALALLMFIYGGVMMLTAAGSDRAKTGREIVVWTAVGLIVIFSSYVVVNFVISQLNKAG